MAIIFFPATRHSIDSYSIPYTDHIVTRLKWILILNFMLLFFANYIQLFDLCIFVIVDIFQLVFVKYFQPDCILLSCHVRVPE